MLTSPDGTGYELNGSRATGGYDGYGTGANRALPGGSWRLPRGPFMVEPDAGEGYAPPKRRHVPVSSIPEPTDIRPSIPTGTLPVKPKDEDGGGTKPTDTQRLIDAFRAMFGTPERRNRNDGSVVLVDAGDHGTGSVGGSGAGGAVKIILVAGVVGVGGWWLWKRYGGKVAA